MYIKMQYLLQQTASFPYLLRMENTGNNLIKAVLMFTSVQISSIYCNLSNVRGENLPCQTVLLNCLEVHIHSHRQPQTLQRVITGSEEHNFTPQSSNTTQQTSLSGGLERRVKRGWSQTTREGGKRPQETKHFPQSSLLLHLKNHPQVLEQKTAENKYKRWMM